VEFSVELSEWESVPVPETYIPTATAETPVTCRADEAAAQLRARSRREEGYRRKQGR
jgi:hypothetical protein